MSNFTYVSAFNLSEKSPCNSTMASSSSDDSCSICLEPFTLQDPATVTSCKHEYHLQCIIEWSQRSKECPICWQFFLLKDPVSQELLAAVDKERLLKTSNISSSSPPPILHSEENTNPCLSPGSMTPSPASRHSSVPADSNYGSRISPPLSPSQSPDPSEASSLPEAIKCKLAAASARYKESISKSKQGLKEKLLARNSSVKELSKGVQREMNAGVARMIERLDIASKRFGGSTHVSTSTTSGFNFSFKGKREEEATSNNGDKTESHKLQGGGSS